MSKYGLNTYSLKNTNYTFHYTKIQFFFFFLIYAVSDAYAVRCSDKTAGNWLHCKLLYCMAVYLFQLLTRIVECEPDKSYEIVNKLRSTS